MQINLVHAEAAAVIDRLAQLGLTETPLRESIYQAYLQRIRLTLNHPRIYPGLVMWGEAVASLREQLRVHGWERLDEANFPLTVNEQLGIAITVASGDEATGNQSANPSNRSKKGPNTVDAIEANRQLDMFAELIPESNESGDVAALDTWVLLHHIDPVKKEIRIEFSRPCDIGDDGKIRAWSERIILNSISIDDDQIEIQPPSGPDINIDIRRKA